jgi:hypothetical protein
MKTCMPIARSSGILFTGPVIHYPAITVDASLSDLAPCRIFTADKKENAARGHGKEDAR